MRKTVESLVAPSSSPFAAAQYGCVKMRIQAKRNDAGSVAALATPMKIRLCSRQPWCTWQGGKAAVFGMALASGLVGDKFSTAVAEPGPLSGTPLKQAVAGTTVHLDTPLGGALPIVYGLDGALSGTANASLGVYLGSRNDRGRWWVSNNRLCHKWETWFNSEIRCMQVFLSGVKIRWLGDDGKSGTATIALARVEAAAPLPSPSALGGPPAPEPGVVAPMFVAIKPKKVDAEKSTDVAVLPISAGTVAPAPVQANYGRAAATPAAAPPLNDRFVYRVARVAANDVLNMRRAPSHHAGIVAMIPSGARGIRRFGSCVTHWCRVRFRQTYGWVNKLYLDPDLNADLGRRS